MSSMSLMEWNTKTPLQWEWENLMMLNATPTELPRKLIPVEWDIDGEEGMDSGSLYSSGGAAGGSGVSGSDLDLASSKSLKSASINSSSLGEVKATRFSLEAFEAIPDNVSKKKKVSKVEHSGTSPVFEAPVGSGEPLLSLKLGKQTYFEDDFSGSNAKPSSYSTKHTPSPTPAKRSKLHCQRTHLLCCQVEGCNLNLSSAKDYHRKHRVCESHSKSPKVIIGGLERRFCQQCSRFHGLSEFDEKRRSCRRRLSDHNARRRKPQTEAVHFSAAGPLSAEYDGKQLMSFAWNKVPFIHNARRNENFTWEGTFDSRSSQLKGYASMKARNVNVQLQLPGNQPLNSMATRCHDSTGIAEALNQGIEESTTASNMGTTQDLHHALSLLSNERWTSCEAPKHGSLSYPMHVNGTSVSQPTTNAISQSFSFPRALSENWQMEQRRTAQPLVQTNLQGDGDNHFQEFQLVRAPYDGFYSDHIN
ncbi:Ran BP2/NZF zinc finger-like superfamily protein isoform 1 [Hibiscus syriacus]|uniref:Ran BP2/NZF zinc finger-like superfamily protein isoform 1 n=1 Tax=Hibiscus syriacus TaxID=106335 RepID=A0A6A3BT38_HIBSY|nr:squamosa promoter-binding-like protein 2 [Hibiscus syriacus]XP_039065439.1 squamosa promoter-binding-like protein 2 [Hibiscus syriacus]KAE8719665.1 Ran BP2/NZF zinc finger-like superfamily protein isoform 1 [Hibiscus syriacus]